VTSGISIDANWATCNNTQTGFTQHDITAAGPMQTLGTDFLATTCIKILYRGFSQTGNFKGTTYWNYDWA
jgi:hypothetical protein